MRVHAVTGSPGTGKHAAAAAACGQLGLRMVDLGRAAAGLGLCEYDASDRTSDVDVSALAGALSGGSRALSDGCVAVGHLAPYVIPPDRAGTMVVLRRSPYELERVYAERGYGAAKAADNLGAEILGVVEHDAARLAAGGGGDIAQVDTTGATVCETARAVAGLLRGAQGARGGAARRGRGGGGVDWLALVAERGDLHRFFPGAGKLT